MRRPVLALAALALALACNRQPPAAAYASFVAATHRGDSEKVWAMLSKASQARLDALAKEAAAAADGVVTASGKALVLGNAADESSPIGKDGIELVRESLDRAVLKVAEANGRSREVTLVQEGGWRVDLTGLLAAPTP